MLDLHAHTVASDGGDRPEELVAAAATTGVETLAVTDHDTVAGVAEARAAGDRLGVEVLAGCERNLAIGERLERLCGVGYDDAVQLAGASALSRAHFARAMVARGAVADVAEAFERYLSSGRAAD